MASTSWDTGIGTGPGMLPRLGEAFTPAEHSAGGLGPRSPLVRGLAELRAGETHAAGAERGSEVTIRSAAGPEPPALSEIPTGPRQAGKRLRILVVEDNQDSADTLQMLLELYGHEVRVAYSGPAGVQAGKEWKPDVVLCDIGLPGLDGYGVVGQLRRSPATAKARMFAVTGYGSDADRRRALEAGFDRHMVKPVDPETLRQALTEG
jgi:CheY-like chemotaxis protein